MKTQHWALREGGQKVVRVQPSALPASLPAPRSRQPPPHQEPVQTGGLSEHRAASPSEQPAHPDLASSPQPSSARCLPPVLCPAASCLISKDHIHKPQAL